MSRNSKPSGYVLYKGASLLDGQPIVVIATVGESENDKTGAMVQTWILVDNGIAPHISVKHGDDVSVCGDCKHRPSLGGSCYVRTYQAPYAVYTAYLRGRYPMADTATIENIGRDRMVRLGSYGDPAAAPAQTWFDLVRYAYGHTGYSHQWQHASELKSLVMASCDTPEERNWAQAQGWRTFTVRLKTDPLAPRESVCPASHEAGKKLTCSTCGACNGANGRKGSIAIQAHGALANRYRQFRLNQVNA